LTGEADHNQDGWVGLDELYDYIFDAVREATPNQTPGKWTFGLEGDLHLARRGRPVVEPSPLPLELQQSLESPLAGVRAGTVQELVRLANGHHQGLALGARLALEHLAYDDSRAVATAAAAALTDVPAAAEQDSSAVEPTPAGRDGVPLGSSDRLKTASAPSRRTLIAVAAAVAILGVGGLVGWRLWPVDTQVDTIPAGLGGMWSGNTHVYDGDVTMTLRLTAGSRLGRQDADPSDCRLNGNFSEISGTRSTITMTFEPDLKENCLQGTGTLTLTAKGDDTLLAEFQPDSGPGSWDSELHRQNG